MKIVLVSNFLNHHQIPFCEHIKTLCDEFCFVATENGGVGGYQVSQEREYVIDYATDKQKAEDEILTADAVIFGACPDCLVQKRMAENKLSFIYSERMFKKGTWRRFIPKNKKHVFNRYINFKDKNLFVLAASAFLPYELFVFGFNKDKIFKWGYFPDCLQENSTKKREKTILWAGRMLDWKHPETAVKTARYLMQNNLEFIMNIVGDGPQLKKVRRLIKKYHLESKVNILGSKTHNELLNIMAQSSIFMFTSDFNEGWGAVLNEAMGNQCAIVANSGIGSVPFLLNDNNAFVFKCSKEKDAYKAVKELLENPRLAETFGKNAKTTIENEYNYKVAAERFINAVKEFYKDGKITPQKSGVLSGVEILKNNWFK